MKKNIVFCIMLFLPSIVCAASKKTPLSPQDLEKMCSQMFVRRLSHCLNKRAPELLENLQDKSFPGPVGMAQAMNCMVRAWRVREWCYQQYGKKN